MRLLGIAASHRPDSYNRQLLAEFVRHLPSTVTCDVMDYATLDMPHYNDSNRIDGIIPAPATLLRDRLASCHGVILATPEYNWSYPGSLKNIIDWVSHFSPNPFAGKTALLMSATPSKRGGVIGMQQLRIPLDSLDMHTFPSLYALGEANIAFSVGGALKSDEKRDRLARISENFVAYTAALHSIAG